MAIPRMRRKNEPDAEAKSLDQRLAAAEAAQVRRVSGDSHRAMAQGYRFLGEVVGGVLMGAALGYGIDEFVTHRPPWALVVGLLGGSGLSIFVAVRTAARTQKNELAKAGQPPSLPDTDED
jgi:ATP synthase protein I